MTLTPYRKVNVVDAEGNLVSFGGGGGGGGGDASAANQLAEIERLEEIRDRLTPPLIQLALVSRSATGDATLIAAQASKKIRVYSFVIKLLGAAENIVLVKDGTTTIDQHALIVKGDVSGFLCEFPVYTLSTNTALVINTSSIANVIISNLLYEVIDAA